MDPKKSLRQRWEELPWLTFLAWVTVPLELNPAFQFYKSWSSGEIAQVSPYTFGFVLLIGAIWFAYALSIKSWPLVWGNAIKLATSASVLALYYWIVNS